MENDITLFIFVPPSQPSPPSLPLSLLLSSSNTYSRQIHSSLKTILLLSVPLSHPLSLPSSYSPLVSTLPLFHSIHSKSFSSFFFTLLNSPLFHSSFVSLSFHSNSFSPSLSFAYSFLSLFNLLLFLGL